MRFVSSLLLSVNAHLWTVVAFTAVWALAEPEPRPEPLRVELLRLPASQKGNKGTIEAPVPSLESATQKPSQVDESTSPASFHRTPHAKKPIVTSEVTVSKNAASGSPLRKIDHAKQREAIGRSRLPSLREKELHPRATRADEHELMHMVAAYREYERQATKVTASGQMTASDTSLSEGGDTRPLIEIIQARIDAVTPLMHRTAEGCRWQTGVVRLRFVMNRDGYPCGLKIDTSSGSACLDAEVDKVLHMAEPYPYVAGWIPVTVKFHI